MTGPRYTNLAKGLPASVPFVGPEAQERMRGEVFGARLGANECVFGPSPAAIAAMADAAGEVWKYCDPENHELKAALAVHHGVAPENIVVGEGIDALLGYLVRLTVEEGDKILTSLGAYPTFNFHVAGFGGEIVAIPYKNDHEDPMALVARASEVGAKLIYFANPDNPMGTWHDAGTVQDALNQVPDGAIFVLDEAYIEFAPEGTAPPIDVSDKRTIRMRTFSKAYGMAGARIGYAIGHADLIRSFDKIRNHFGVNRIAQAGALAALQDQAYLQSTVNAVAQGREKIAEIVAGLGLSHVASATNFVAIDCGKDGAYASRVLKSLIDQGIFVRMPFAEPQNRCIRVSVGKPHDLELFKLALTRALSSID